jgi:hypothetical protein
MTEDELELVDYKVKTLWEEIDNILKVLNRSRSDLIPEGSCVDDLDDEKILSLWAMDETNRLIFEQKRVILGKMIGTEGCIELMRTAQGKIEVNFKGSIEDSPPKPAEVNSNQSH